MLRGAWLGDWPAPWALAAISQAWLLGGSQGRWPQLQQEARRATGPRVLARPTDFVPRPQTDWVALLRHRSRTAPPGQRGPRENESRAWAWAALLDGDGSVWMAQGSVLLDHAQRLRWLPLLGAVDAEGTLRLPPFLELLVPEALHHLPPGWWECLLRAQDPEGRLLPEGALDMGLPWPGNVRELLHALERAILRCEETTLRPRHFPELDAPLLQRHTWEQATRDFQRGFLLEALRACEFHVADTAESLGLARPAHYATARRLGVDLVAERLRRPRERG